MSIDWFYVLLIALAWASGLCFGVVWAIKWNASRHHHRWAKWSEPKLVEIYMNGKPTGGQARFQERYCETCGEGESRRMA